jgi:hypothetical protein
MWAGSRRASMTIELEKMPPLMAKLLSRYNRQEIARVLKTQKNVNIVTKP